MVIRFEVVGLNLHTKCAQLLFLHHGKAVALKKLFNLFLIFQHASLDVPNYVYPVKEIREVSSHGIFKGKAIE